MKKEKIPFLQDVAAETTPITAGTVPANGVVTLTQCNVPYAPEYDLQMDCMLSYVYGIDNGEAVVKSWATHRATYNGRSVFGMMVAINRDSGEYLETYAGDRGMMDVQTRADGSYCRHSVMGDRSIYYMVPTDAYVEYKWKTVKYYLDTGLVHMIAFEEPEFWNVAGYSLGFQQAYEQEYGTPWQPPETSADVRFRTQKLKALMYVRAMDVLSRRIKEHYPSVKVLLATHSVDDYCAHGIATALSHFAALPCVDGFIGQTWSDGVVRPLPCEGEELSFSEGTALFQYRSYQPFLRPDQSLYLLQDPSSDNPAVTKEWREENWRKTVVASMLQNDTPLSEFTIWPQRAFLAADADYKTIQLNVYKPYQEMHTLEGAMYTGTTGIALGLSDTAGWCIGEENIHTGKNLAAIFGLTLPLIRRGVPVDTVCLDTLESVEPLKNVSLLLLTYDGMKPLSPKANRAIAEYVKNGGQVLYIGGNDGFSELSDSWWYKENTTPLGDLLNCLGFPSAIKGVGVAADPSYALSAEYGATALIFDDEQPSPITAADKTVGFFAPCEKGGITVLGLPVAWVSSSTEATRHYLSLCEKALQNAGRKLEFCPTMAAVRGRYVACCALQEELQLNREHTLLDLFDPHLTCLQGGKIAPHMTGFFYDVTDYMKSSAPKLLFTGGVQMTKAEETTNHTVFSIAHPSGSCAVSRLYCAGKKPSSITAKTMYGNVANVSSQYDPETDTLCIYSQMESVTDPVWIIIQWE